MALGKIRRGVKKTRQAYRKVKSFAPVLGHLSNDRYQKVFKPKELAARYHEYRASVDLAGGLKNTDGFKQYVAERKEHLTDFPDLKLPDKLSKDFKTAFTNAMVLNDNTKKAQENIGKTFDSLNNLINADPPDINLNSVASVLQTLRKNAEIAINIQHQQEIKNVKELFVTPAFRDELNNDLKLDAHQITLLEKDMLAALEKTQQEEKNKLDTNFQNEVKRLLAHHQAERSRIAFLAIMYKNNSATRAAIDALRKKLNPQKNTSLSDGDMSGLATFKGIKVGDIGSFETLNGTIVHNNNGAFSIELPKFLANYTSTMSDFTTLAEAVKACGNTSISVTIDYQHDKDHAMELGRRAYEAAVLADFNPAETPDENNKDKKIKFITIKVNGEEKSAKELFGDPSTRLDKIHESYKDRHQKREDIAEFYDEQQPISNEFKAVIENTKAETKRLEIINNTPPPPAGLGPLPVA